MSNDLCRFEQAELLEWLVTQEGPIHVEIAARRLAAAWNLEKVGKRMRDAVDQCIFQLGRKKTVFQKEDFLYPATFSTDTLLVRLPVEGRPESVRKIEHIAPEEIHKALTLLIDHALSLSRDSLIAETRKLFGFNRTGGAIQQRLQSEIENLLAGGVLVEHEDKLALQPK